MVDKIFVIGLDSAAWPLLERERENLPNLWKLFDGSLRGPNESTIPPLTVPAWASMVTGVTPGELGIYGFRNRPWDFYQDFASVTSRWIPYMTIWRMLGIIGKNNVVFGVPPCWPVEAIRGSMVSGFMMDGDKFKKQGYPDTDPPELGKKLADVAGGWEIDVEYTGDPDEMKEQLFNMTDYHFAAIEWLMENEDWDYFHFVEIGFDRVHHIFWRYWDRTHHNYPGRNPWERVIPEYYRLVDKWVGRLLSNIERDNTAVIVVSDHGMKAMKGGFVINDYLREGGYLHFDDPQHPVRLSDDMVDWNKTIAWGWGGYYARIFLNVKGRERNGVVTPEEYSDMVDEVKEFMEGIHGPNGEKWDNKVYIPADVYRYARGWYPDLMVYLDNLNWRSIGSVGHDTRYLWFNDTRPDDAVHDSTGIIAISAPGVEPGIVNSTVYDFVPTIFGLYGYNVRGMHGESLLKKGKYVAG